MMKKSLLIASLLIASNLANAQVTQTLPNGSGGYNTYSPNGAVTQTLPNGSGGYNSYSPSGQVTQTLPNGSGGYNSYTPNGAVTQTLPNGSGGYNSYGSQGGVTQTLPNGAGGYNTYSPEGNVIQTLPNGSGGWNTYGRWNFFLGSSSAKSVMTLIKNGVLSIKLILENDLIVKGLSAEAAIQWSAKIPQIKNTKIKMFSIRSAIFSLRALSVKIASVVSNGGAMINKASIGIVISQPQPSIIPSRDKKSQKP